MVALVSLTLTLGGQHHICVFQIDFFFLVFLCILKFQQFDSLWLVTFLCFVYILLGLSHFALVLIVQWK